VGQGTWGFAVEMTLELGLWLGMAGLALSSAGILLWRTRRSLSPSRQTALVPEVRLVPSAGLVPTGLPEPASAVLAS